MQDSWFWDPDGGKDICSAPLRLIPRRWTLQLFGMGLYSPEARTIASTLPVAAQSTKLNLLGGLSWLISASTQALPVWILIIGTIGGVRRLLSQESRHGMLLLLAFSTPNVICSIFTTSPSTHFSMITCFLLSLSFCFYLQQSLTIWCQKIPNTIAARALPFALILTSNLLSSSPDAPIGIDQDPAGQAAVRWLKKNTKSRVCHQQL